METIANKLEKILDDLQSTGGIELCAIVSKQGLLIVSGKASHGSDSEAFAALTATLYMSAESTTTRLTRQKPRTIIVDTNDKQLITYAASGDALLVVLIGNDGYIGLVLREMKKAAEKVRTII